MKKQDKIFFVENLTRELSAARSLILINFAGLSVKNQQELKKRLKEAGGRMIVVKNTLLKRAGEAAKLESEVLTDTVLTGQTALVVTESDPISPLTVLGKFAKEFAVPKFKVGIVEGAFQNTDALIKLAALPGRDTLLAQLLGVLMGPKYQLVSTLQVNLQKLVFILNSKAGTEN